MRHARGAVAGLLAVLAVLALVAAVGSAASPRQTRANGGVTLAGMRAHLVAFQRIADRNSGNRFAGTAGYDASAAYVARRLRAAGYRVRGQRFPFTYVADRSPPLLRIAGSAAAFRPGRDYATLAYSGSGRVEAEVVAVDLRVPSPSPDAATSGCEPSDFAGFPRGAIALVQRGACTFRQKLENALAAGAGALVVFNEGNPGRRDVFGATLGPPQAAIPALATSFEVGDVLRRGRATGRTGATVTLRADVVAETRRTSNVLAESRAGDAANVVMLGAHLDSVREGPGLNDNGSGSALVLEVAEELARTRTRSRLRFAWWGAEELGLIGSRHYVARLSPAERRRIAVYLNFDMVGSRNFVPFVYDGDGSLGRRSPVPAGSAAVERAFARAFAARGLAHREANIGAGSDHWPFARAGIPVGGLFTGADSEKTQAQADAFGGRAGRPLDPCYHRRCDTLANVSSPALARMGRIAEAVVGAFARDVASVRRAR